MIESNGSIRRNLVKLVVAPLVLVLGIGAMTGCKQAESPSDNTQQAVGQSASDQRQDVGDMASGSESQQVDMANPVAQAGSLDAVEKAVDVKLSEGMAEYLSGRTPRYATIGDDVAEAAFEQDGHEYTLRFTETDDATDADDDIAGIYGETVETYEVAPERVIEVIADGDNRYLKIAWTDPDATYSIVNTDGASIEEMLAVLPFGRK